MSRESASQTGIKLSFCINTRNRAAYLPATLESVLAQITNECEIVIVDGASSDATPQVCQDYAKRFENVRYLRQEVNGGLDGDLDMALTVAKGEFCWLMPDDDVLRPGAVRLILGAIRSDCSLILVNAEQRDLKLRSLVKASMLNASADFSVEAGDSNTLFKSCWNLILYLGSVVIRRTIWLSRNTQTYYGTDLIHVGVIFQAPLPGRATVIAQPQISIRVGRQSWTGRYWDIWLRKWPVLMNSFVLSEDAKGGALNELVEIVEFPWLFRLRALGFYHLPHYRLYVRARSETFLKRLTAFLVALIPETVANTYLIVYNAIRRRHNVEAEITLLRQSPTCCWLWRLADG